VIEVAEERGVGFIVIVLLHDIHIYTQNLSSIATAKSERTLLCYTTAKPTSEVRNESKPKLPTIPRREIEKKTY